MRINYSLVVLLVILAAACKNDPMAKLPSFDIRLPDSTTIFNTGNIPNGKTTVLLRFDAYCRDCQVETDSLLKNMDALKDVRFYFVTTEPFSQVKEFNEFFKLPNYPNIMIGHDFGRFFPKHFKSHSTPFIAIYNKNLDLVGIYDGKPLMSELLASIQSVK